MREFLAEHWGDIVDIAGVLGMSVLCYLLGRVDGRRKGKGEVWLRMDGTGKLVSVIFSSNIVIHRERMPKEGGAR